jgi:hypothetical protein
MTVTNEMMGEDGSRPDLDACSEIDPQLTGGVTRGMTAGAVRKESTGSSAPSVVPVVSRATFCTCGLNRAWMGWLGDTETTKSTEEPVSLFVVTRSLRAYRRTTTIL